MDKKLEQLALDIFDAGAIKFGSFKFKIHEKDPNFPLSSNKIDLRNLPLELIKAIACEMVEKTRIAYINFDLVCGLPKAGEPFAEMVAKISQKPFLKMDKKELPDGTRQIGKIISGNHQSEQEVLGIDDVMSQGESKREWKVQIQEANLRIAAIIVTVDREEGGSKYLESLGCPFYSIFSFSDLLKFYQSIGKISCQQLEESLAYSLRARQFFLESIS